MSKKKKKKTLYVDNSSCVIDWSGREDFNGEYEYTGNTIRLNQQGDDEDDDEDNEEEEYDSNDEEVNIRLGICIVNNMVLGPYYTRLDKKLLQILTT